MNFSLTILGSGAATPTLRRGATAQLLIVHDKYFLIDCGEGTQVQLRKFKTKFQRIHHIFISHLHGDHYLGLIGLLSSMHLLGRKREIHIYAPEGLQHILDANWKYSQTQLAFPVNIHATTDDGTHKVFEDNTLEVYSFPLNHRIACTGFLFKEKPRERKVKKESIAEFGLTVKEILKLKAGEDLVRENGSTMLNDELTDAPAPPRSYAFCSDTAFHTPLIETLKGVNLLYHEATFENEMEDRAKLTFHSTAKQAASIAKAAQVKRLVIGHFSSRYGETDKIESQAKSVFANTVAAVDGMVEHVPFEE